MTNQPMIHVPQMCQSCQHELIVKTLRMRETEPWRSVVVVANIMLFTAASTHEMVWQRCGPIEDGKREAADLSIVLAEIGCLACFDAEAFGRVRKIMKSKGVSYAAQLSQGKITDDPDWPYLAPRGAA